MGNLLHSAIRGDEQAPGLFQAQIVYELYGREPQTPLKHAAGIGFAHARGHGGILHGNTLPVICPDIALYHFACREGLRLHLNEAMQQRFDIVGKQGLISLLFTKFTVDIGKQPEQLSIPIRDMQ